MKAKREIEVTVCDGCDYQMGQNEPTTVMHVPVESQLKPVVFHFHYGAGHDCFRYWASNTSIMDRSLKYRGFDEEEIETFMFHHAHGRAKVT